VSDTTDAASIEPLSSAHYYAFLEPVSAEAGFGGARGPVVALEPDGFACGSYLSSEHAAVEQMQGDGQCPVDLAQRLRLHENDGRMLLVVADDGQERTYQRAGDLSPIDSEAKAAAAVWLGGGYSLSFSHGETYVGSLSDAQVRQVADGYEVIAGAEQEVGDCESTSVHLFRVRLLVRPDGTVEETDRTKVNEYEVADPCMPLGRRPEGFADRSRGGSLRDLFARAAHHEAESVRAFRRFARELEAYGAPAALGDAARVAARDEVRHASMWVEVAAAHGVTIDVDVAQDDLPSRSLEEVALDNAVEGCVFETYGAFLALYQSRHATTRALRAHFTSIADDELDHAALSHACAEVLEAHLDEEARIRVWERVRRARRELLGALGEPTSHQRFVGYPSAADARVLFRSSGAR
jgi:hypothetical protein